MQANAQRSHRHQVISPSAACEARAIVSTRAGFCRVMNLAGGMIAYNAAKLPVATT